MSPKKSVPPKPVSNDDLFLFERKPWGRPAVWLGLGAMFLFLDYITGPYIFFPVFFIIPILLVAWHRGFRGASAYAVVLSGFRLCFPYWWHEGWESWEVATNGAMQCGILVLLAFLMSRTAIQTRELRRRVKALEGILPICSFCKNIRDEQGRWIQMEIYVSSHSEAEFSHGFCPKCMEKNYGDLLRDGGKS